MLQLPTYAHKITQTEEIDLGTFYICDNLVIGLMQEGVNLTIDSLSPLIAISEKYFELKDFAYISIRENSYSVNPTIYPLLKEMKNLKGIAIVTESELYKQNFVIEKHFYCENMKIFDNLKGAIDWCENLIE